MKDFDRGFNRMRRFVTGFIITVAVLIVGYWVLVGIVATKVISDPEGTTEKVGETARKIKDAFDKGFNSEDTLVIEVDTLNVK